MENAKLMGILDEEIARLRRAITGLIVVRNQLDQTSTHSTSAALVKRIKALKETTASKSTGARPDGRLRVVHSKQDQSTKRGKN